MEKNKVIFLDRDGTINKDYGYVSELEKLEFLEGVIEGLQKLIENEFKLIIVTNQSGIGRNYFSLDDYEKFNNHMLNELSKNGINITKVYYCPHKEEDNCTCRKPKLGLFYKAISDYNVDLEQSYAVGDKIRDLEICNESKVKGILISRKTENGYVCKGDFLEVVNYILNK